MLEIKTYTTKEIVDALGVSEKSFKNRKAQYLADYIYEEVKVGRSKSYVIIGYNEPVKSGFIQAYEASAKDGIDIKLPNESTAMHMLLHMSFTDCTFSTNEQIGKKLGLDKETVARYIRIFRNDGILPYKHKIIPEVRDRDGFIIQYKMDMNKYQYAITNMWNGRVTEVTRDVWSSYWKDYFNTVERLYEAELRDETERLGRKGKEITEGRKKLLKQAVHNKVRFDFWELHGRIDRYVSKKLSEKAATVFKDYFSQLSRLAR